MYLNVVVRMFIKEVLRWKDDDIDSGRTQILEL